VNDRIEIKGRAIAAGLLYRTEGEFSLTYIYNITSAGLDYLKQLSKETP